MDLDAQIAALQGQRRRVLSEIRRAQAAIALLDAPVAKKQAGSAHEEAASALLLELNRLLRPRGQRVAVLPIGYKAETKYLPIVDRPVIEAGAQKEHSAPESPRSPSASRDYPKKPACKAPAARKARNSRKKVRK